MRARTMAKDGDKDDGGKGGARGKVRRRRTVCVRVHECVDPTVSKRVGRRKSETESREGERETRIAL